MKVRILSAPKFFYFIFLIKKYFFKQITLCIERRRHWTESKAEKRTRAASKTQTETTESDKETFKNYKKNFFN